MKPSLRPSILAASVAALLAPLTASAQDVFTWTGGTDGLWSSVGNWTGPASVPNGNDILNFAGTTNLLTTNDLAGPALNQHRIFFNSGAGDFTLGGAALSLFDFGGNAPKIENNSSFSTQTINLAITLDSDISASKVAEINPVDGNLIFGSTVSLVDVGELRIFGNNFNTVTFNGAISGTGSKLAVKQDSIVVLNAANTFTGNVEIDAGEVRLGLGGSLNAGSAVFLGNGGTTATAAAFSLGSATGGQTFANAITVNPGDGTNRAIRSLNTSGTNTITGNIALDGVLGENRSVTLDTAFGGTLAVNTGVISGAGQNVIKTGGGTLVLGGTNTYSGNTTINDGTLSVSADANLGVVSGGLNLDGGTLNMTAAFTTGRLITLGGVGTVTTATGASIWNGQVTGVGGVTKNGAGSLQLTGVMPNDFFGPMNLNQGTLFLNKSGVNAIGSGGITITSNNTAGFGAATASLSASEQIDDTAPVSLSANAGLRAGFDLNNFTETVGAVTITSVTNGSATIALGATGKLILTQDLIFNANRNAAGNTGREVMITGTGTYATAGVGGTLDLGGVPRTISVFANNAQLNSDATIEAVIDNGTLVKSGARVLRLGAVNTYSALTVNEGTVRALVNGAIPAGIPLTLSGTSFGSNATADFNGFNYTLTPANNLVFGGGFGGATIATGAGTLTLNTPLTVDLTNDPQTLTVSGNLNLNGIQDTFNIGDSAGTTTELLISAVISGSATGLTKTGAGALALGGANTFTGPVVVTDGTLALRGQNSVPSSPQVGPGATLRFDTALADNAQFNNILGAAANGISVDGGTIQDTKMADRLLTGRVVTIGAGGATFDISGTYTNFVEGAVSQLRFNAGTQTTILSGTAGIVKNGGGRIQFQSPSPSFSGPVTLNDGTTESGSTGLGNGAATNTITINGGNWAVTGNSPSTAQITLNGGAMSTNGSNQLVAGPIDVTAASRFFLNNFWTDAAAGHSMTISNVLTGGSDLLVGVNRVGYDNNSGAVILQNTGNTYSGTITIEKNLNLDNTPAGGVGKTIGTAAVTLAGGHLRLKDNGAGSNGALAYGNNVVVVDTVGGGDLAGTSGITADRVSGINTGNTFQLGTLSMGAQQLDVSGSNGYKIQFNGLATFTDAPTLNVTSSVLTLAGGVSAPGLTFTKTGAGTLRLLGTLDYAGYTLTAGTIEFPVAPPGVLRDIAIPINTGFGAGFVATQANLIDRITFDSAGVVALGVDSTFNPDFTGFTGGLRLGGSNNATLTGTITSAGSTVLLGGGGGTLTLASTDAFSGAVNLDVNTNGTAGGKIVLAAANNYSGTTSIGGGMTLSAANLDSLGSNASISFDNGTLQLANGGNFAAFGTRTLTVGAGGATLDTDGNSVTLPTALVGAGAFTKTGNGTLTLTNTAATFAGKTAVTGGTLSISADTNLGAVPGAAVNDQLTLSAGMLQATGTFSIPANRRITLGASGGVIEVTGAETLTLASTMSGTGTFTKEGTGTLLITADPNNNGLYTINNGVLALQHAGATDANMVINNSGTLRVLTANDLGDAYTITVNTGGTFDLRASDQIAQLLGTGTVTNGGGAGTTLTVNSATNPATPFSGVMQNGTSALGFTKAGGNLVTLTGANTYTGTTLVNQATLAINGAVGAIAGSAAVNVGDGNGGAEAMNFGLAADVWAGGTLNRIADTANVTINGATTAGLTYTGPANGDAVTNVETIGTLTFSGGRNNVTLLPGTGNEVQITTGTLARTNNGTGLIRGTNLNGTGAGSTRLVVTTPTGALTGAGGADGATNKSIVRYLLGDTSATGAGTDFVTLDGSNGVRLLTAGEYSPTIAGDNSLRNVSVAGGETVASNVRINSLRATGGNTTINAGATVNVNSGAILFTDDATIGGGGIINFGANEGIIHVAKNTTAATGTLNVARLSGTGGLTYGRSGDAVNFFDLGGDNTVVGNFINNMGTVRLLSPGALNDNIPMTPILRPGTALLVNGNNVTLRDLQSGGGTGTFQNGAATAATITSYLTADRAINNNVFNGGTGALNLVVSGGFNLTFQTADQTFTGSYEQRLGTTTLQGNDVGEFTGVTSMQVNGGTLRLTSTDGNNDSQNRINNAATLALHGATFDFNTNATGGVNYAETIGALSLNGGANTMTVDKASTAAAETSTVTFASLTRTAGSATAVNFNSQNNGTAIFDLGTTTKSRLVFTTAPTLDDGIIGGWATVDSSANTREWAKYVSTGTISVTALTAGEYTTTLASGANPTQNVKITASPATLTGNTEINSLNLAQASQSTVNLGGSTLRVESGGILVSGDSSATINNGTLTAGTGANTPGELLIHTLPFSVTGLTWTNATDTVALANVVNGTPIIFTTAPGGLTAGVTYYATNATATTFQVSAARGSAVIAITNDGTTGALSELHSTIVDAAIADNGSGSVSLTKAAGTGVLDLLGNINFYTGRTVLNGGITRINADANLGAAPLTATPGHLQLNAATLEINENFTLDANRGLRIGNGTSIISILSGTGATGKTLTYNGAITSIGSGEGNLTFLSNAATTTTDPGEINATLTAPLDVRGSLRIDAGTMTTGAGTNVIGRSLQIGMNGNATFTQSSGSLTVGAGINDTLDIGFNIANAITTVGAVNLTGLPQFTANVDQVRIGAASAGQTGQGTLTLGIDSEINAGTQIIIGSTPGGSGNAAAVSSLVFGSGVSNIATRTFTVGGDKSRGSATVAPGGIVNLNGFAANTMDLLVANYLSTGVVGAASTFDMTGGTLNASLNALTVGQKTGGTNGGTIGIFTLSAGSHVVSANSAVIGRVDGNSTAGTNPTSGTVNIGGGTVLVNNDVAMATWNNNTGTPISTGTLNVTGGSVTLGGNITRTTTNETASNSFVNVAGGTLDLQSQATGDATPGSITASQLAFRSGSILDVAGATLTATSSTNSGVAGTAGDALIVRDTTIGFPVSLTGATAGNVHYEAAGAGAGATIAAALNLGGVARTVNVEDSAGAANDLTLSGAISNATTVTKTGAGTLAVNAALGTGTSTLNANVGTTSLGVSQTLAALNIAGGATVVLSDVPPPAPAEDLGGGDALAAVAGLDESAGLDVIGAASTFGETPSVAAVPEPGTFGLLALGALGLLARRRNSGRRS